MRAKKSLGQNFLRDDDVCRQIVDSLGLRKDEIVIEIGPGRGALTGILLENTVRVIAIEFDRDMIAPLRVQFGSHDNFELINADALSVDFAEAVGLNDIKYLSEPPAIAGGLTWELETAGKYDPKQQQPTTACGSDIKLVANLPYNISTPILQRLIEQRSIFSTIVLMFQREVVERITAKPGNKNRGFLSVMVENAFETEYLFDVPPQAFQPVPKVWSAVVRLTPKISDFADSRAFRRVVSASFAQKRKTILNNLKPVFDNATEILLKSGIDPKRRAETLTLDEWRTLANIVGKNE